MALEKRGLEELGEDGVHKVVVGVGVGSILVKAVQIASLAVQLGLNHQNKEYGQLDTRRVKNIRCGGHAEYRHWNCIHGGRKAAEQRLGAKHLALLQPL